ncbi:MAG: glycosyltransferase family 2 protein [Planctomycetales bacterium]|nr:glycosyltransferase family 2 protein [Planctomycetales bacterium]
MSLFDNLTTQSHAGTDGQSRAATIAVVIPCYQVERNILAVLTSIGPEVDQIICVDDASTDCTAEIITDLLHVDPRIQLISRETNGGVGAAVLDGYQAAIRGGADVIVKLDGDGQMNSALIPSFCAPILSGAADYVKGNRFFFLDSVRRMPWVRILGNAGLSFMTKLSTGYWDLFDPTNGYTAIHAKVAQTLPFDHISKRFFFESDLLFRLGVIRARVLDLPLESFYGDEVSNLSVRRCLLTFPWLHARNLTKRLLYNYFIRNFSVASINLLLGLALCMFGVAYGLVHWQISSSLGHLATAGTVMTAALPVMLGTQLLLNFLSFDISLTPREPLQQRLAQIQLLRAPAPKHTNETTASHEEAVHA